MRSTVREARQRLADMAPALNAEMYRRYEAELKEAERTARGRGEQFASERFAALDAERQRLLVEACEVRDAYEHLEAEGALHRLSAREYADRLAALDRRRDRVEARTADIARQVEEWSAVEDDPVAWTDEQYAKFPTNAPLFTF